MNAINFQPLFKRGYKPPDLFPMEGMIAMGIKQNKQHELFCKKALKDRIKKVDLKQ